MAADQEFLSPADFVRTSTFCTMAHLVQRLASRLAIDLEPYGLNPTTLGVLGQVAATPDNTPSALARACDMSPQRMAGVLQRLESAGWLTRSGPRGRGRPTSVSLTPWAVDQLITVGPHMLAAGSPEALGLTDSEATHLHTLLSRALPSLPDEHVSADPVVLVQPDGTVTGTADKRTVHTAVTPLHLAFSAHLRRPDGKVLITRRSLAKQTWPGVWTNSVCGHLRPGETPAQAAQRRIPEELGTTPRDLSVALPDFAYHATDASGIVENELCPVLIGTIEPEELRLDPQEVTEVSWVDWADLRATAQTTPQLLSPWCVQQLALLPADPWQDAYLQTIDHPPALSAFGGQAS